jgi:hypothetical protein
MKRSIIGSLALGLAVTAGSAAAQAETAGGGYSVSFVERPLTLTAGALRLDGDFNLTRLSIDAGGLDVSETFLGLNLGGAYAINADLEVFATLPLALSPDADIGDPRLGATYRLLRGATELGGRVTLALPVQGDFGVELGVPVLLRLGDKARLDTGAFLGLTFGDTLGKGLLVPAAFSFQLMPELVLGAGTALNLPDFDLDRAVMPLSLGATYTLANGSSPFVDIGLTFSLPAFLGLGGGDISTDLWTVVVSGRLFRF